MAGAVPDCNMNERYSGDSHPQLFELPLFHVDSSIVTSHVLKQLRAKLRQSLGGQGLGASSRRWILVSPTIFLKFTSHVMFYIISQSILVLNKGKQSLEVFSLTRCWHYLDQTSLSIAYVLLLRGETEFQVRR